MTTLSRALDADSIAIFAVGQRSVLCVNEERTLMTLMSSIANVVVDARRTKRRARALEELNL